MSRYHVNPETGEAGPCRASSGNCPFGGESDHHDSASEARKAYETSQEDAKLLEGLKKSPNFVTIQEVDSSELQHPDQKATRVGNYFVSTRPVPSINAKGMTEQVYETMVIDSGGTQVEAWSTADPDPEVHSEQHASAIGYAISKS